MFRVVFDQQP